MPRHRITSIMRVAIIADIHGNKIALDAVLQDLHRQEPIDQVVIAGDLCLNGPQPRAVLETVREMGWPVIQGNVDSDIVQQTARKGSKKQNVIAWTREQIGSQGIQYLAELPFSHLVVNNEGNDLLVVHANPLNQNEALFPDTPEDRLEALCQHLPSTIGAVAFGHYHVPYQRRWRHLLLVDAGSSGLSRDGDRRAAYAILVWQNEAWQVEHRRVAYDVEAVVQQLKSSGLPASTAEKRIRVLTEARY
jgi:putative phosphoesterase